MTVTVHVGNQIRSIREARGLSQAQLGDLLAEHLGKAWPRQTVHTAEIGRRGLSAAELWAIALVLDVQVGALFPANDAERTFTVGDEEALRIGRAVQRALARS